MISSLARMPRLSQQTLENAIFLRKIKKNQGITPQDNDEHGIRPPVILMEKYGPPLYQSLGTWESQVWLKHEWMNECKHEC